VNHSLVVFIVLLQLQYNTPRRRAIFRHLNKLAKKREKRAEYFGSRFGV